MLHELDNEFQHRYIKTDTPISVVLFIDCQTWNDLPNHSWNKLNFNENVIEKFRINYWKYYDAKKLYY